MSGEPVFITTGLEGCRSYLILLARLYLEIGPKPKIEPSDLVQQTLLEAYKQREKLPKNPDELCVWLRTVFNDIIRDQRRHWLRQKRDIRREQSLDTSLTKIRKRITHPD